MLKSLNARENAAADFLLSLSSESRGIEAFGAYVLEFYGEEGVYPHYKDGKPLAHLDVGAAIFVYLATLMENGDLSVWGGGDSLDRERVRDLLTERFGYSEVRRETPFVSDEIDWSVSF